MAPRRREAQARGERTSGRARSSYSSRARAVDTSTCRTGGSREAHTTAARKTVASRVSSHRLSTLGSWAIETPIVAAAATSGRQSATARNTCATPPHTDVPEPFTSPASHAAPAQTPSIEGGGSLRRGMAGGWVAANVDT